MNQVLLQTDAYDTKENATANLSELLTQLAELRTQIESSYQQLDDLLFTQTTTHSIPPPSIPATQWTTMSFLASSSSATNETKQNQIAYTRLQKGP